MKNVSRAQQVVLDAIEKLWKEGGRYPTLNEIARASRIGPPTASKHVANLVSNGYVQRNTSGPGYRPTPASSDPAIDEALHWADLRAQVVAMSDGVDPSTIRRISAAITMRPE